jgi:thiol-disulfide isomerase/thioredoxin
MLDNAIANSHVAILSLVVRFSKERPVMSQLQTASPSLWPLAWAQARLAHARLAQAQLARLASAAALGLILAFGATSSPAQDAAGNGNGTGQAAGQAAGTASSQTQAATPSAGQEQGGETPFPDLTIPPKADRATLEKIIAAAKGARPRELAQYRAMQTAIRDASAALIKLIKDPNDPVRLQAELDSLSSSAALMVNDSEASRDEVLERILTYLEGREELTLGDVQTGMIVAFYLEMQPQKSPARDVYALLDELLEKDARDEMQALRLNLQANIRRLELLGNKFELDAVSTTGKRIKTEDFAGKFVLVDFFATWCAPCLAEVPQLRKHYDKYRSKGLEVIAISIDEQREDLDKYLAANQLPWLVIHDGATDPKEKLQTRFGISSLPYVLLLNKEGVVVSLEARGPELDRLMQRIFEEPTPAETPQENNATGTTNSATSGSPK